MYMYSAIISGKDSQPGTVFAPERAALLCLQKMTEILYPRLLYEVLTQPN